MSFTDQQRQAIDTHDKNLIVVAGAGSGKTRVLVERYITLLEGNPDWALNSIVAITFTKAAALEMRDRVRKEIERHLYEADSEREKSRWSRLLAQMDSARIDTIHGLCAGILRANAAEANIDPGFTVLDQVDTRILLADIVQRQLNALVGDEGDETAILLTEYDLYTLKQTLTNEALIHADLGEIPSSPDEVMSGWQREWIKYYQNARKRLTNNPRYLACIQWEPLHGWPQEDRILQVFQKVHDYLEEFTEGSVDLSYDACSLMIQAIDRRGGKAALWGGKDILAEAKDILQTLKELLKAFLEEVSTPPGPIDEAAADLLVHWYRLILRIRHSFQMAKQERGYLDFSDLEAKTAQLLYANESVRDRYRGAEIKTLLVDEFQDTNEAQWTIVRSLVDLYTDTALFVVGDQKQSIYGFRGADVAVFERVRQEIAEMKNGLALPLSTSFRSHPGLIEAFNKLFASILQRDTSSPFAAYQIEYEQGMTAHRDILSQEAQANYAPIEMILLRNQQPHLEERIDSADRRTWEAYEMAQRLHQLKQDSAPIFDPELGAYRPFDYGDVAILFQSTGALPAYEEVFKLVDLPFVTVAGRGYYDRQEVWDVINLLRCLHNPSDHLALASALRSPIFGLSDDQLFALSRLREAAKEEGVSLSLWDALAAESIPPLEASGIEQIRSAHQILSALQTLAGRMTISELLREALSRTGYLAMLTGLPNGARLRRNVEKLLDIADASAKVTLEDFSYYLAHLTEQEAREGEATLDTSHAVQLMTVHASKGLEFPIVVLADAGWTRKGRTSDYVLVDDATKRLACSVYDDVEGKYVKPYLAQRIEQDRSVRDDAERKRLLYVAATRARDCLMIYGELKITKTGASTAGWLGQLCIALEIESLDELEAGLYPYTEQAKFSISLPEYDPDQIRLLRGSSSALENRERPKFVGDLITPSAMQSIPERKNVLMEHIAATHLANLGGYRYSQTENDRSYYRNLLSRQMTDDMHVRIPDTIRKHPDGVSQREIGDVVHTALRYWVLPDTTADINRILKGYARQKGIHEEQVLDKVARRATKLLEQFQDSDLFKQMNRVREQGLPFYSEIPFIYRTEKQIIHGIIDLLLQTESGEWLLLDYKTSTIQRPTQTRLQEHARRYHLQVGAYASAVQQELSGIIPTVLIHYIQYNQTITIPTNTWQSEIKELDAYIGDMTYDS